MEMRPYQTGKNSSSKGTSTTAWATIWPLQRQPGQVPLGTTGIPHRLDTPCTRLRPGVVTMNPCHWPTHKYRTHKVTPRDCMFPVQTTLTTATRRRPPHTRQVTRPTWAASDWFPSPCILVVYLYHMLS